MDSFTDNMMPVLKGNDSKKNSRSPLDDPFFAESLIIQSKSIVGRMYSANEYAKFQYECQLNQLVKEYRVWLSEVKREERKVLGKLDVMRQEQRGMRRGTSQLVEKTNREFINHYTKKRRNKDSDNKLGLSGRGNAKLVENIRLPEIIKIKQGVGVMDMSKGKEFPRAVSLPFITTQKENRSIAAAAAATKGEDFEKSMQAKKSKRVDLLAERVLPTKTEVPKPEVPPLRIKSPRVLSAPKSKREGGLDIFNTRPSSACETIF